MLMARDKQIAILVPCKNEAVTIRDVVEGFRRAVPGCTVYVYDNNSTDDTAKIARDAGAIVGRETRAGKGNVVRRMFSEIDADVYVMVDGDNTYDASQADLLINKVVGEGIDMAVGARIGATKKHQRAGHAFGNRMFNVLYSRLFGQDFSDIFSGYSAFSRRFVKSFPAVSAGFEIETELSVHASQLRLPVAEIDLPYQDRPEGSESKLSTFRDGARILKTIIVLLKEYKPLYFFGGISLLGMLLSVMIAIPVFLQYMQTGHVEAYATAVLATGVMIVSMLSMTAAVVLDSIRRMRAEIKRMFYNLT